MLVADPASRNPSKNPDIPLPQACLTVCGCSARHITARGVRLLPALVLVPGMRTAGNFDAQRIDRGVGATEQRSQVRPAEREVDGLLRPPDDADAPTVRGHDPDAARPRAINPADAVDLEAVGDARLAALVEIGEDAAPDHVAVGVKP